MLQDCTGGPCQRGASRKSEPLFDSPHLDDEAGALSVEVEDDGRGIRADDSAGVGMISMRERTEELGGWCTVESVVGGGTLVRALLPLQTEGEAHRREE